jgi:hypothetical protein
MNLGKAVKVVRVATVSIGYRSAVNSFHLPKVNSRNPGGGRACEGFIHSDI